jgi:hypothetical protein
MILISRKLKIFCRLSMIDPNTFTSPKAVAASELSLNVPVSI